MVTIARVTNPGGGRSYQDPLTAVYTAVSRIDLSGLSSSRATTSHPPAPWTYAHQLTATIPRSVAHVHGYVPTSFLPYRCLEYITFENFHQAAYIDQIPIAGRIVLLGESLGLHHALLS